MPGAWSLVAQGIGTALIEPGKPWQNVNSARLNVHYRPRQVGRWPIARSVNLAGQPSGPVGSFSATLPITICGPVTMRAGIASSVSWIWAGARTPPVNAGETDVTGTGFSISTERPRGREAQ